MAEYMAVTIEIGGTLPASLIGKLLHAIKNDLSDINGPSTEEELRKEAYARGSLPQENKSIKFYAQSNYGQCEDLKAFCRVHHLSYIHTCEANDECDGSYVYWEPGMDDEEGSTATQDGDMTVRVANVRPLVLLLLEYAKKGNSALPLFITNDHEGVKNAVEKGLKKPEDFLPILEKEIQKALPIVPELSPFIIKE